MPCGVLDSLHGTFIKVTKTPRVRLAAIQTLWVASLTRRVLIINKVYETVNKTEKKRRREQYVVEEMIRLYCRKNHDEYNRDGQKMCTVCQELSDYARLRSEKCPFMENKTFCANCSVHCYRPDMRERIREVMRFSGPRMILYHPVLAMWHVICSVRQKRKSE